MRFSDGVLDGYGACDRVGWGGEHEHEPVAETLDLVSAVHRDELTEEREMSPVQGRGLLGAESLSELRRTHEIGEHHRDDPTWQRRTRSRSVSRRCIRE